MNQVEVAQQSLRRHQEKSQMSASTACLPDLNGLETAYAWSINQAIESDDTRLASELAEDYQREVDNATSRIAS